jgi:hypothetical protein
MGGAPGGGRGVGRGGGGGAPKKGFYLLTLQSVCIARVCTHPSKCAYGHCTVGGTCSVSVNVLETKTLRVFDRGARSPPPASERCCWCFWRWCCCFSRWMLATYRGRGGAHWSHACAPSPPIGAVRSPRLPLTPSYFYVG